MTTYPPLLAGQRFTAAVAQSMLPNYIVKASSLPAVVSSTTLVNDGELANIPLAIGVWEVIFYIYATGDGAATTAGQINTAWTFSGTASGFKSCVGPAINATTGPTTTLGRMSIHNFGTTVGYGVKGTGTFSRIEERAGNFSVSVAGNLALQYAQINSSATATTVQAGSYLTYRQVG